MTTLDWTIVHLHHARHQLDEKARLLCRRGIAARVREAAKKPATREHAFARLNTAEEYARKVLRGELT